MTQILTLHRKQVLVPLLEEINRFGAISRVEAQRVLDPELLVAVQSRRLIRAMSTPLGDVFYLSYPGRSMLGLPLSHKVNASSLMMRVCLRAAGLLLIREGRALDTKTRRQSLIYQDGEKRVLVSAKPEGFDPFALRRVVRRLKADGFDELHVYTFLGDEEALAMALKLYDPVYRTTPKADPRQLMFHVIRDPFDATIRQQLIHVDTSVEPLPDEVRARNKPRKTGA
jgi:hypothetical protein